jgi:hypothetical protein
MVKEAKASEEEVPNVIEKCSAITSKALQSPQFVAWQDVVVYKSLTQNTPRERPSQLWMSSTL